MELLEPHTAQSAERQLESLVRFDLRRSAYHELASVSCSLNEKVLTLTGRVSSYYLKQIAQRIAFDRLKPTIRIINELRVEQ